MTWCVWSVPESASDACLVVGEFEDEAEAEEATDRRNATAEKLGLTTTFVYLPEGEEPLF